MKVPWVPTTPQARLANRRVEQTEEEASGPLLDVPPPPVLPTPPAQVGSDAALTTEEVKVLSHLRGLQAIMPLPPEMQQQYEQLLSREKVVQPILSHGHLNRLKKLQTQMQGIAKKIGQVDADWKSFAQVVASRIQDHTLWYQQHRAQLMEQFNQKSAELQSAKEEVSQASASLVETTAQPEIQLAAPNAVQDAQAISALLTQPTTPLVINLEEGPQDMEAEAVEPTDSTEFDEAASPSAKADRKKTALRPTAFSRGSPRQVAQGHLKVKQEK